MEFKSLKNIESDFQADTAVRHRLSGGLPGNHGLLRMKCVLVCRSAAAEDFTCWTAVNS